MSEKIYVIGHKSPDLDSVVAAISYANLKNKLENTDLYTPAAAGSINKVTEFVLSKFEYPAPEILKNANDAKIILVDHNEESQQIEGKNKQIIEILDHHKMNFSNSNPIKITVEPLGSSNSLIYKLYKNENIEINKRLAGLMLSAVLDDTVITKSPTCTEEDQKIIADLVQITGISHWQEYGIEMFKAKANVGAMSEEEIVKMDYKDFNFKTGKIGVGQVETVDLSDFKSRQDQLLETVKKVKADGNYHTVMLFITDILKEGSLTLVDSNEIEKVESALTTKFENNASFVEGLISRKKQVVPAFTQAFDN